MATQEEISALRLLIAESIDAEPYTDARLSSLLGEEGADPQSVASSLWREKAARFASLVDVQEGNSKRSLSQLQKQALEMAATFESGSTASSAGGLSSRATRIRKIERQ